MSILPLIELAKNVMILIEVILIVRTLIKTNSFDQSAFY